MSTQNPSRHPIAATITSIIVIVLVAAITLLVINRQRVIDTISVLQFTPSSEVAAIEERMELTNEGRLHFYATHPEVSAAEVFNTECPQREPGSPILGCYAAGRIFIFGITDERLDGIEEVTAAHEMLHAVWERLDQSKRDTLTQLLEAKYVTLTDPALKERMEYYDRTQPGERVNELHSILATEKADLGPELEAHYATYFENRSLVVGLYDQYNSVFTQLTTKATQVIDQMEALSARITQQSTEYTQASGVLSADITRFNARANNNEFTTATQFNNERSVLMSRSNAVDALRAEVNQNIETYNSLYNEYQQISSQIEALNGSINSIQQLDEAPKVE